MKIDLVGHEGGNSRGEFCFTLTVTDIATGWAENQTVRNKTLVHVFAALSDVVEHLPFSIRGTDSDNGSEFINDQLFRYCLDQQLRVATIRATHASVSQLALLTHAAQGDQDPYIDLLVEYHTDRSPGLRRTT